MKDIKPLSKKVWTGYILLFFATLGIIAGYMRVSPPMLGLAVMILSLVVFQEAMFIIRQDTTLAFLPMRRDENRD